MHIDTWLFRPRNKNAHVYVPLLCAEPRGDVVRPYKHGPCAMRATLVAKRIESIGAHTQPDVPCIAPELFELDGGTNRVAAGARPQRVHGGPRPQDAGAREQGGLASSTAIAPTS